MYPFLIFPNPSKDCVFIYLVDPLAIGARKGDEIRVVFEKPDVPWSTSKSITVDRLHSQFIAIPVDLPNTGSTSESGRVRIQLRKRGEASFRDVAEYSLVTADKRGDYELVSDYNLFIVLYALTPSVEPNSSFTVTPSTPKVLTPIYVASGKRVVLSLPDPDREYGTTEKWKYEYLIEVLMYDDLGNLVGYKVCDLRSFISELEAGTVTIPDYLYRIRMSIDVPEEMLDYARIYISDKAIIQNIVKEGGRATIEFETISGKGQPLWLLIFLIVFGVGSVVALKWLEVEEKKAEVEKLKLEKDFALRLVEKNIEYTREVLSSNLPPEVKKTLITSNNPIIRTVEAVKKATEREKEEEFTKKLMEMLPFILLVVLIVALIK